ncbi:beta-lactamase family protein [Candidatus Desantisbacteria bacterium]|nr:beta-lactamase family protein [Candidatus Desantisbacteria bacterium]
MRKILLVLCLVTLAACVNHSMTKVNKDFQSEVDRIRAEFNLPGMTAAYILNDGTSGTASSGFSDIETKALMKDNTRMLAASIGKSFVGALSIALAQEGRLTLDEPISRWLGKYDWFEQLPNHESITLRHLLTQSSGLPDHVHMEEFQKAFASEWKKSENTFTPERLVRFILNKPALFPAGQGWAYSDTGYILAGMVLEEIIANSYYDEIHARFIKPLKVSDTSPSDRRNLHGLSAGYMSSDNPFGLPAKTLDENGHLYLHPAIEWTGGGLITTSLDLSRWGAALFTGKALSGEYLSELFTAAAIDPNATDIQYGAGIAINTNGRFGPVYGHAGWIPGYISSLRHYRNSGVTIAFQINTDSGVIASNKSVVKKIEERLLEIVIEK